MSSLFLFYARRDPAKPIWRAIVHYNQTGAHLYLQRADHPNAPMTQITQQRGLYRSVTWSPDGRNIALVDYGLMLVNVNQRKIEALTSTYDGSPAWSPDGKWVVFMSQRDQAWDIYKIHIETGETVQLAKTPRDDANPRWSKDGEWVYFQSYVEGAWSEFRVPSDGSGNLERLSVISDEDAPSQLSPIIDYAWRGKILVGLGVVLMVVSLGVIHPTLNPPRKRRGTS